MRLNKVLPFALSIGIVLGAVAPGFAGNFRQNHPRRAEVLGRDRNLGGAIGRDRGRLGGNYGALRADQRGIAHQEQADARANGGYITKQQKQQLNGEENNLRNQVSQDYTGRGNAFGKGYGRGGGMNGGGKGGMNGGGGNFAQNHPRRAEVLGRDNNLNRDINQDRGQLGGNYNALKTDDRSIRQQEQADSRANGGYITQQQKQQLNGEENNLRQQVGQDYTGRGGAYGNGGRNGGGGGGGNFAQNHPRRAEVLGRDNNLNRDINQDRGQLGGNYNALKTDDRSIRQQEQADARANGGYITGQQKQQLNGEENQLRQQIGQDFTGQGGGTGVAGGGRF